jgi:hypothetical protein
MAMAHVAQWQVRLEMFEEGDRTTVRAVLDTGANVLTGEGVAVRNPADAAIPEIGTELAAGRALADLGRQLGNAAVTDIEGATGNRATVTI